MLSCNNLLKPMDGKAVTIPTQDMILGSYYPTMERRESRATVTSAGCGRSAYAGCGGEPMYGYRMFRDFDEAMMAYVNRQLGLHSRIRVRIHRDVKEIAPDGTGDGCQPLGCHCHHTGTADLQQPLAAGSRLCRSFRSCQYLQAGSGVRGQEEAARSIIDRCIRAHGTAVCAEMLDNIKAMGYKYSTQASSRFPCTI